MRSRSFLVVVAVAALVLAAVGSGCATAGAATSHGVSSSHHHRRSHARHGLVAQRSAPGDDRADEQGEGGDERGGGDLTAILVREGVASYYHDSLAGNLTADGEKYNPDDFTCAHRTLPFNTVLVVENLETGKKTRCRVNDRGPYVDGRLLDVSRRVARELGMISRGVIRVRISIAKLPTSS